MTVDALQDVFGIPESALADAVAAQLPPSSPPPPWPTHFRPRYSPCSTPRA